MITLRHEEVKESTQGHTVNRFSWPLTSALLTPEPSDSPRASMKVKLLDPQSWLTLSTPMGCSPQAPLSMGFPRYEYWSGLSFPSPGDLLTQGLNPGLPDCRQILYHLSHTS